MMNTKYQEAFDYILSITDSYYDESFEFTKSEKLLQELIDKQKWHDLRKDPNDLPRPLSTNLYVLADWNPYCLNKYGLLDFSRDSKWCIEDTILDDINVIAWRYLERFEDE